MAVLAFEDVDLEPLMLEGMIVPVLRLTDADEYPTVQLKVGDQEYHYDRSYNLKGYSAVLPKYLRELYAAGKQPLLMERPTRYYVYVAS